MAFCLFIYQTHLLQLCCVDSDRVFRFKTKKQPCSISTGGVDKALRARVTRCWTSRQRAICDVNTPAVSAPSLSLSKASAAGRVARANDLMLPVRRPIGGVGPAQRRPIASPRLRLTSAGARGASALYWLLRMPRIWRLLAAAVSLPLIQMQTPQLQQTIHLDAVLAFRRTENAAFWTRELNEEDGVSDWLWEILGYRCSMAPWPTRRTWPNQNVMKLDARSKSGANN